MRIVRIVMRDGDDLPDNIHTSDGAARVIQAAAPSLTEEEACRVRDLAFERFAEASVASFAALIAEVLGPDVRVLQADE